MIFRQLTNSNDWTFGKGIADYAQNQQAIALNIQTLVLSWVGDCFFSLPSGINWKSLLNVGQMNNLNSALQVLLANAYGVMSVVKAQVVVDPTTRMAVATYTVNTVYSQQISDQLQVLIGQTGSSNA